MNAVMLSAYCFASLAAVRLVAQDVPATVIYRTTPTQEFSEVCGAEWSRHTGPGAQLIDLDRAERCQMYRGIGGSFAEASCYTLMKMPEPKRAEAFDMLFGENGLRLSTARIHCAASDYSLRFYSYDDIEGDVELKNFSIDEDRKWVIPAIKEALKRNPDIFFFSSPWSAPGWMKENGTMCGSRLRSDMYGTYADYIVKFIQAYAQEGICIQAHTPQNEVLTQQTFNSPTMRMLPEDEARFVLTLRPKFVAAGLKTKIWIFDHNYAFKTHVDGTLAVPGVREAIDGVAWHSYAGVPEVVEEYVRRFPELENIHTEMGPHIDRSQRDFLSWGELILRGFNAGQTGFTNWCLALDENGQPNISCGFGCAGLITVHSRNGEIIPSNQYQAFRHISPYVRPGAKILKAMPLKSKLDVPYEGPEGQAALFLQKTVVTAFENPDGSYVVVANHPEVSGAQLMLKKGDLYLPVQLLGKSLTTILVR